MTYLLPILIGLTTLGGYFAPYDFPPFEHDALVCQVFPSSRLCADLNFGSSNFPTSVDVFENPSGTGQVSTTVTHSAHHTNANEALELIERKLGTGASTSTNNTIFVGDGTGTSAWSTSATSTNFLATNFTTASSTIASTSIQRLLATNSTTTNLYISNIASTTDLRANVSAFGQSSINNLNVTTCTGCSAGISGVTIYTATTSASRYMAKTLSLISGDTVIFCGTSLDEANLGNLIYRISSPWSMASTTVVATSNSGCHSFLATTTETVTFSWLPGGVVIGSMQIILQNAGYTNTF